MYGFFIKTLSGQISLTRYMWTKTIKGIQLHAIKHKEFATFCHFMVTPRKKRTLLNKTDRDPVMM